VCTINAVSSCRRLDQNACGDVREKLNEPHGKARLWWLKRALGIVAATGDSTGRDSPRNLVNMHAKKTAVAEHYGTAVAWAVGACVAQHS